MLKRQIRKLREGDWGHKFLSLTDVDEVIDESCEIYGPDGKLSAMLLRNGVTKESAALAWGRLKHYHPKSSNRGLASGNRKLRTKKDGTLSKTWVGDDVSSGIIGYFDRYPRIPYCRKCAWNQQHPEAFVDLLPLCQEVSAKYAKHWPNHYAVQQAQAEKTHPDFIIPGTVFTTITVNKNYRTAAHRDPKNLKGSISSMLVLHDGMVKGGELILPELNLALRFRSGDLVWFENQKFWHGNAPVHAIGSNSQRCTLVFYFREKMTECGSHEEELARARNLRPLG